MTSDRVGDFIIRLKNAGAIGKREVRLPYSAHIAAIAKKLSALGYVGKVENEAAENSPKKELLVELTYANGIHKIRGVKRLSTPGRRLYIGHDEAHQVAGGTGARILSTNRGILTDAEARRDRAGGETLFEIW